MATSLDDLTAEVTAVVGVEQSAIKLIDGIAAQIAAAVAAATNGQVPAASLVALTTQLSASSAALAAAVAANTPAAPVAPVVPVAP